jgi:hypothetical protein
MRRLSNQCWQLLKGMMQGTFRLLFRYQRQRRRLARSGFVFPTTMMMLLIVALTAGALTFRAYNRSTSAILARQQEVIQNAASPAIDRAKAKIEYLFSSDTRSPRRVPTSDQLRLMLLGKISDGDLPGTQNDGVEIVGEPVKANGLDIYTLDDEERVDLNGINGVDDDNAWVFSTGDGSQVIYSITIDDANPDVSPAADLDDTVTLAKAQAGVTRNGPINTIETSGNCGGGGQRSEEGWQVVSTARVQKNIQINAYLADPNDISGTVTTLELQQVREGDRSSKWGAWFRYDLEMSAGVDFNWNGATHTQGSLLMGERDANADVTSFMISSQDSCLYGPGASDMTVGRDISGNGFHGQLIRFQGTPTIHTEGNNGDINDFNLTGNNDSIDAQTGGGIDTYENVLLDPVKMYLADVSEHIGGGWASTNPGGPISVANGRVTEIDEKLLRNLSLDDIFRADDRWGPKATYGTQVNKVDIPAGTNIGTNTTEVALTRSGDGLDGYWERQATSKGTRFIVGERLELGNFFGWNHNPVGTPGAGNHDGFDPLYPPNNLPRNTDTSNTSRRWFGYAEQKQRKTLRDNLAAVQGMVVYRWDDATAGAGTGTTPLACIAVTAHHGTAKAVADSRTFRQLANDNTKVMTNFLTGEGTDGWEFAPVTSISGDLATALGNLANFAGDPNGGAPSFEPVQDSFVHPYPYMAMWGDYAMLRRVGTASTTNIADKSTQDTAACTMTLLAYNLQSVKAEYDNAAVVANSSNWEGLADALSSRLTFTGTGSANTDIRRLLGEHDRPWSNNGLTADQEALAKKAFLYWAVERDRLYGFKPSVTADATNNPNVGMPKAVAASTFTFSATNGVYDPTTATYQTSGNTNLSATPYGASQFYNVSCDPNIFANYLTAIGTPPAADSAAAATLESRALTLALGLCPRRAYYPSLFYIFPAVAHGYDGAASTNIATSTYGGVSTDAMSAIDISMGTAEPYIDYLTGDTAPKYNQDALSPTPSFAAIGYTGITATPRAIGGTGWSLPTSASNVDAVFETNPTAASWLAAGAKTTDNFPFSLVVTTPVGAFSSDLNVSVLDKIMYSGRENMAIRVLDMDVARLMASDWFYGKESGVDGVEHFGLTYAFREDAVREDEIVRPIISGGTNCDTYGVLKAYDSSNAGCYMNITTDALTSTDPPLSDHNISVKPVDYAPDPDRRPYGFRLRNGADFGRASDEQSGLTFITDNTLIVQGDFNLHQDSSNVTLEEFSTPPTVRKVDLTKAEFYDDAGTGRPSTKLNLTNFATSSNDSWRPAELIADAIYIQSDNFKDGFVSTAYVRDELGIATAVNQGKVSFENSNMLGRSSNDNFDRPASDAASPYNDVIWREDGRNGGSAADGIPGNVSNASRRAPIYFDRNGVAWYRRDSSNPARVIIPVADQDSATDSIYGYHGFQNPGNNATNWRAVRTNNLQLAADNTTVNALIVSGVTPIRFDQTNGREQIYGSLSNFPRFNESWEVSSGNNKNLFISGAFYQLFLSHTATAPYEASTWEAEDAIASGSRYFYYQPPNRIWGYDVAFQYSPPHPVTARFVSVGNARSEFYRELPVDDPYIQLLRCAKDENGQPVLNDPNVTCP